MNGISKADYISTIPEPQSRQDVYMYNICIKLDALTEFIRSDKGCRCSTETKDSVREFVASAEKEIVAEPELEGVKTKTSSRRKKKVEQVI